MSPLELISRFQRASIVRGHSRALRFLSQSQAMPLLSLQENAGVHGNG